MAKTCLYGLSQGNFASISFSTANFCAGARLPLRRPPIMLLGAFFFTPGLPWARSERPGLALYRNQGAPPDSDILYLLASRRPFRAAMSG